MLNFVINNTNKKISTLVSKKAFEDIINSLPKVIDGIKINSSKNFVLINPKNSKIILNIDIKISKTEKISEKIRKIKNKLEEHCLYLIGSRPQNIIINYLGSY